MNHIRIYLVFSLLCFPVNVLLRELVWDSFWVIALTSFWFAIGLHRVFGRTPPVTASFKEAARCSVMAVAWPLMPKTTSVVDSPTK
jgi:hypothetical protein